MRSDSARLPEVSLSRHGDPAQAGVVCASLPLAPLREAWQADGRLAAGLPSWLCADEMGLLAQFPVQKRQLEWLAGRLAAKQALNHYRNWLEAAVPHPVDMAIRRQPDGRPFVDERTYLSISHSRCQAVAAVANCPVGVDVESFDALQAGSIADLLAEQEVAAVATGQGCDRSQARTLIWCLKEALFKACGQRAFVPFARAIQIQGWPQGQAPHWRIDSRAAGMAWDAEAAPACGHWRVETAWTETSAQVLVYRQGWPGADPIKRAEE